MPYAQVPGFDLGKLNNPKHQNDKYTPAVRAFSQGLGAGVTVARGQLDPMLKHIQANGFPQARAVGDDKIDFGDGRGAVDVITSQGALWFNNQPGGGGTNTRAARTPNMVASSWWDTNMPPGDGSVGSYLTPSRRFTPALAMPGPYQPGSVGSYLS